MAITRVVEMTLALGGTGKTGQRVAQRRRGRGRGRAVRWASRFMQSLSESYLLESALAGGVQRALGRPPRALAVYARTAAVGWGAR